MWSYSRSVHVTCGLSVSEMRVLCGWRAGDVRVRCDRRTGNGDDNNDDDGDGDDDGRGRDVAQVCGHRLPKTDGNDDNDDDDVGDIRRPKRPRHRTPKFVRSSDRPNLGIGHRNLFDPAIKQI